MKHEWNTNTKPFLFFLYTSVFPYIKLNDDKETIFTYNTNISLLFFRATEKVYKRYMNFNLKKQSNVDQVPSLIGIMFRVPNVRKLFVEQKKTNSKFS